MTRRGRKNRSKRRGAKPRCFWGRCKARHERDDPCDLPACSKCGAIFRGAHVHRLGQPACDGPCEALLLCEAPRSSERGDVRCSRPEGHKAGPHVSPSGLYTWW